MKKVKKPIIFLVLCLLCISVLSACASSKSLNGRWTYTDGSAKFSYIEFFSDGTYTSSHANYNGSYSIDGDRLKLSGILVEPLTYTFDVSGDTLTFLNGDSVTAVFEKAS